MANQLLLLLLRSPLAPLSWGQRVTLQSSTVAVPVPWPRLVHTGTRESGAARKTHFH